MKIERWDIDRIKPYERNPRRNDKAVEWDVDLLPIELGELRDEGFDLKLVGFADKELAEHLRDFDTDLDDSEADPDEAAETVHCPKCGREFSLSRAKPKGWSEDHDEGVDRRRHRGHVVSQRRGHPQLVAISWSNRHAPGLRA